MYQSVKDGEAALGRMVVKFVGGIRAPRRAPVTQKQIERWFHATDKTFLNKVLSGLVADGRVRIEPKSLGSARKFNGS